MYIEPVREAVYGVSGTCESSVGDQVCGAICRLKGAREPLRLR
jgi:hypothetical protein